MELEEVEIISVEQKLEQAVGKLFDELENETLSQEERSRKLNELMTLLKPYMEWRKTFEEQNLAFAKFEAEKLSKQKDQQLKMFELILNGAIRGAGITASTILPWKQFSWAERGEFLGRDQMNAIQSLQNNISKI